MPEQKGGRPRENSRSKNGIVGQKQTGEMAPPIRQEPGTDQEWLDQCLEWIGQQVDRAAIEVAYINPLAKNMPTLVVQRDFYWKVAEVLKKDPRLDFNYLVELHGTDYMTHMSVFVFLYSFRHGKSVILKTNLEREHPSVSSLADLWPGANWPECEAYDLLGIRFEGHPNLHRIFLGDDWKGHPLRKDYKDENHDFLSGK